MLPAYGALCCSLLLLSLAHQTFPGTNPGVDIFRNACRSVSIFRYLFSVLLAFDTVEPSPECSTKQAIGTIIDTVGYFTHKVSAQFPELCVSYMRMCNKAELIDMLEAAVYLPEDRRPTGEFVVPLVFSKYSSAF